MIVVFNIGRGTGQLGVIRTVDGWTEQYLIKGIPLGHGVREACSTVGICGAKVLAFRQLYLDLNRIYSMIDHHTITSGQNRNRNISKEGAAC